MDFNKIRNIIPDILIDQAKNYIDDIILYFLTRMPVEKKQELGALLAKMFESVAVKALGEEGAENIEQEVQDSLDNIILGAHIYFDKDDAPGEER